MERTTIMLPAALKSRAIGWARERGISLGELLRESLERALDHLIKERRVLDPLFSDDAVYDGDAPLDLSENHDRYLYK